MGRGLEHRSNLMPPAIPNATYRLQLTSRFGFDAAAKLVPYLKTFGTSHLYISPCLKARSGSTHGYDVVDHNAINPELGGEDGFRRLSDALRAADMGIILDFVPNHMAVHHADNPWWLDVLEWGPKSPHAASFDIDWTLLAHRPTGGVLIPILGVPYGEALESGEIDLRYNPEEGSFSVWYYENRLPITPTRYAEILDKIVSEAPARDLPGGWKLIELAARHRGPRNPPREKAPALKAELAGIEGGREVIERGLNAYRPKQGGHSATMALHHLLERQHYRLAHWRLSASDINYRRFFDINELAGLRVEDIGTFHAIHRLITRLIAEGRIDGLRLDHVDGLRDPHQYFQRLRRLISEAMPTGHARPYVLVEKILAEGERLPRFAGVAGTTGYEWLNVISRVLVEGAGLAVLDRLWQDVSGDRRPFAEVLLEAKRRVLSTILSSEFTVLARLLDRIAAGHYTTRDYTSESLRAALELFILHFPVYRTYITGSEPSAQDRALIGNVIARAKTEWVGPDGSALDVLRDALTLDLVRAPRVGHSIARVRRFAFKVQQFTGPVMAKSLEDTAFYRFHRLLALNEVGGNPTAGALTVGEFHGRMRDRASTAPHGLTATGTHDTKRGEDARTRILALSELSNEWKDLVAELLQINAYLIGSQQHRRSPSAAHEYMLYQALVGAWPPEGLGQPFVQRVQAYALKAAREAKQETSWLNPDERYEQELNAFIERLLDRKSSANFISTFEPFVRRVALLGALNSLSQLTLKLMVPGVPDFYQGTEFWDLSLVDPDNRQPVDFDARAAALVEIARLENWRALTKTWPDGRIKLALAHQLNALRVEMPGVFQGGGYRALDVTGHDSGEVIAFARTDGNAAVVVVVGRLFARASEGGRAWPRGPAWNATLRLDEFSPMRSALDPEGEIFAGEVAISELFSQIPIAVLQREKRRK
jgi:(1->4)-alpha-D-glucan 1-alpha-D-glucosylmutase